jgi:hypothetical protein
MTNLFSQDEHPLQPEEIFFDETTGYLILQLAGDSPVLRQGEVVYKDKTFQPKQELHITILSREAAESVKIHLEQHPDELESIQQLINNTDWSFRKRNQFFRVEENQDVESIVQLVQISELKAFFQKLSEQINTDLEPPPAHITLYTRGNSKGIGIPTNEDFKQLAREEINMGELETLPKKDSGQG